MLGIDLISYHTNWSILKMIYSHLMFMCYASFGIAQQDVMVKVDALHFGKIVNINHDNDTLMKLGDCTVTTLKMYITKVKFYHDDAIVHVPVVDAHLIDFSEPSSCQWHEAIPHGIVFNKVKFNVGVDSLTHTLGPMDGALDPINGMYWTWQSGYINVKIEGTSSRSHAKGNAFQYHLGGYHTLHNTLREITLPVYGNKLHVGFDIGQFFENVDFDVNHIMSPGRKAAQFSTLLASYFSIVQE